MAKSNTVHLVQASTCHIIMILTVLTQWFFYNKKRDAKLIIPINHESYHNLDMSKIITTFFLRSYSTIGTVSLVSIQT